MRPVPEIASPAGPTPTISGDCTLEVSVGAAPWESRGPISCGEGDQVRFLVAGDVGEATPGLSGTVLGAARVCEDIGCDMGLLPGDLIYGRGGRAQLVWDSVYFRGLAQLGIPFAAVLGNHAYRVDPGPALKREVLLGADGKAGLILPGPSYALRVLGPDGEPRITVAALDTDSVAAPSRGMPGLGADSLERACSEGTPVVWLGHHPISSQGFHRFHEAGLQRELRETTISTQVNGCRLAVVVAGHDHDLQAYGPSCEAHGAPGQVLAGASQGTRPRFSRHLETCPADEEAVSVYRSSFGDGRTGFAWVGVDVTSGKVEVRLYAASETGEVDLIETTGWL